MEIELLRADESDAKEIWNMQKAAFAEMLDKYRDYETNPANEPFEKFLARFRLPFTYFYFIRSNGETVGAIRVADKRSAAELKKISPLFIMQEYRNKGYAQSAILSVEKIHGETGWELSTILQEKGNCHLYEKMGYRRTDKTIQINSFMTLIVYRK